MPGGNAASVRALADRGVSNAAEPARGAQARPAGRWGDLQTRTLSAAVLAPAALLCVWFGGGAWAALVTVAAAALGVEWAALCGHAAYSRAGIALPVGLVVAGTAMLMGHGTLALAVLLAAMVLVRGLGGSGWLVVGVPYLGVPLLALSWLRVRPSGAGGDAEAIGRADVLFVLLVVWASDIGAYVVGRLLGGPKLAPAISPGKTWSGAIGGLVAAMAVGALAAYLLVLGSPMRAAAIAAALAIAEQAGDLFESWVKRRFGVKDSGWLIPGHGGVLDRLDGLLAAAPVAAALAIMFGRGGVFWN